MVPASSSLASGLPDANPSASPRRAIYVRTTTDLLAEDEVQFNACSARAGLGARVFADQGTGRRAFRSLMAAIRSDRIDELYVEDLSRVCTRHSALPTLLETFRRNGVKVILCRGGLVLDPSDSSFADLQRGVALAVGIDRKLRREQCARGAETRAMAGTKAGRKPIDRPDEFIRKLVVPGFSLSGIAKATGVSKTTAHRWVRALGLQTRTASRSKSRR